MSMHIQALREKKNTITKIFEALNCVVLLLLLFSGGGMLLQRGNMHI